MAEQFLAVFNSLSPAKQREAWDFVVFLAGGDGKLPDGSGFGTGLSFSDYVRPASDRDSRRESWTNVFRGAKLMIPEMTSVSEMLAAGEGDSFK